MIREEDVFIDVQEVVQGMIELCENEKYGDGTIYEVTKGETRIVPLYDNPPPSGSGSIMKGFLEEQERLLRSLKAGEYKV
jgi:hypothetical protein